MMRTDWPPESGKACLKRTWRRTKDKTQARRGQREPDHWSPNIWCRSFQRMSKTTSSSLIGCCKIRNRWIEMWFRRTHIICDTMVHQAGINTSKVLQKVPISILLINLEVHKPQVESSQIFTRHPRGYCLIWMRLRNRKLDRACYILWIRRKQQPTLKAPNRW